MKACRSAALLVWAALLGGCMTFNIEPDNRIKWDVEPLSVGTLKAGQAVALKNGYASPDKVSFKSKHNWVFDQQQFTNWAIEELARGLEKNGMRIDPASDKAITLRVRIQKFEVQANYPSIYVYSFARAGLEASFASDGEAYFEESNPNTRNVSAQGSMQLAVLLCLKALGADPKFVAYMNR